MVALTIAVTLTAGCASTEVATDPQSELAAANLSELQFGDDLATTQMLDVATAEIRSLDEIVTGDRAVLLWYWAPD